MIKLVAFDWNGTLLSDTRASWESDNATLVVLGHKPMSLKRFRETFVVPVIEYYVANGLNRSDVLRRSEQIEKIFHSVYEDRVKKVRTRSGVKEILRWLKKNKIESIIYSNYTLVDIERQLKRLGIKRYITNVLALPKIGESLVNRHKGQRLKDYIDSHKLKPHEIVSVGDTCEEVEISKKLGLYSVALTGGYNSTVRLKAFKPHFLIDNMIELKRVIQKLNAK